MGQLDLEVFNIRLIGDSISRVPRPRICRAEVARRNKCPCHPNRSQNLIVFFFFFSDNEMMNLAVC